MRNRFTQDDFLVITHDSLHVHDIGNQTGVDVSCWAERSIRGGIRRPVGETRCFAALSM